MTYERERLAALPVLSLMLLTAVTPTLAAPLEAMAVSGALRS